jgi:uncharacterized protein (DUF58 family)
MAWLSDITRKRSWPPLLEQRQLDTLRNLAQQPLAGPLDVDLEIHQRLLGEKLSPYINTGYEFAEIRPYQSGDSVRFINWRRYASTGQLYINRFVEERRPQCWLVIDRRSSMRFGTHVRLKAAQAAQLAMYYLYKAGYHQLAVGGVLLDNHSHWFEARSSQLDQHHLQQHIIAPCPPIDGDRDEPTLDSVLRQLRVRCQPGCLIFLISDFVDLHAGSAATLAALSAQHAVSALHIIDPVEATLPQHGAFDLGSDQGTQVRHIDCDNTTLREKYNTQLQHALVATEHLLQQHPLHYRRYLADSDLLTPTGLSHA